MSRLDGRIQAIEFNQMHGTKPRIQTKNNLDRLQDSWSLYWDGPPLGSLGETMRVIRREIGQEHVDGIEW